jgi:hypothetical protein
MLLKNAASAGPFALEFEKRGDVRFDAAAAAVDVVLAVFGDREQYGPPLLVDLSFLQEKANAMRPDGQRSTRTSTSVEDRAQGPGVDDVYLRRPPAARRGHRERHVCERVHRV